MKIQVVSQCQEKIPLHRSKDVKVAEAALLHVPLLCYFCVVLRSSSNTYTSLYLGLAESDANIVFLDGAKGCDTGM